MTSNTTKPPLLGKIASGECVFDRNDQSHIHTGVQTLLSEVFSRIKSEDKGFIIQTINLGRVVGKSTRILTKDDDEIVFMQRVGRQGLTRFVKNRVPEESNHVTVILKKENCGKGYILLAAWIGTQAEPEPWDKNAVIPKSIIFWNKNALIYGSEEVVPGTETAICPW